MVKIVAPNAIQPMAPRRRTHDSDVVQIAFGDDVYRAILLFARLFNGRRDGDAQGEDAPAQRPARLRRLHLRQSGLG